MLNNLLGVINMRKCAGLLIVACLFVCFTFNSTFPINRVSSNAVHDIYNNHSQKCDLMERSKKMAPNFENTLRRIKDYTQDFGKNIYDHFNNGIKSIVNKDPITEDEIRQYEELVILKKYPYLDLKELEMKYSPQRPTKNARESAIFAVDRNSQNEPGICDKGEDILNVEIINRGLSGFAIPPLLAKSTASVESKINYVGKPSKTDNIVLSTDHVLKSLKHDINAYIERKKTQ